MNLDASIVLGINLVLAVAGGLLCFRGLRLYKVLQFFLCGGAGGYLGLLIERKLGMENFYVVAIILALIAGYLGYRHYKFGLYLCGAAGSFVVVFSYFWKQALAVAKESLGELNIARQMMITGVSELLGGNGLEESLAKISNQSTELVMQSMEEALAIIQKGLLWAGIAGIVVGVLMVLLGDLLIMLVTAALGATMLISLLENFVFLTPNGHLCALVVISVVGIIFQATAKKT